MIHVIEKEFVNTSVVMQFMELSHHNNNKLFKSHLIGNYLNVWQYSALIMLLPFNNSNN